MLPGDVQAFNDAPIHARVSGYLKRWYADIGTPVKAGQVLAEIDTPDLDQQLIQAKADLATAVANQNLSQITAKRWAGLLAQDAVSRQDADDKNGDLAAKTALVASARANVDRLQALESFKRITAPFDGVVTTRSTDIGALISVGGVTDTPLFTVADERRLRIYVRVPQSYSAYIKPGMTATFTVPEYPGRTFTANLATTADAITPQTGAELIQLQIDNADHGLKAGDYAQVRFALPADSAALQAPASALMFRDAGMAVAVIGPDGRVAIKPITIGRDLGTSVEVATGLSASDRVIDNPPDDLRSDGDQGCASPPAEACRRATGREPPAHADNSKPALVGLVMVALAGCSLAPAYTPLTLATPPSYKEVGPWTPASPGDAAPRGDWWSVYGDQTLDTLELRIEKGNPDLAVALARYDEANALAAQARAAQVPELDDGASATSNRQSKNRPLNVGGKTQYDNDIVAGTVSYEFDLWGRVRNLVAQGKAQAQASGADAASVRLSLEAQLADAYLNLRGLDAQAKLLADTTDAFTKALRLTQAQHDGGSVAGLDVGRAETQLQTARAQQIDVGAQRALLEHEIAALVGQTASTFSIAASADLPPPPHVPVATPSLLLQRRPDIAAAERRAAAANAGIGVARAAYFPSITLDATGGFQSAGGVNLLNAANSWWTLGPTAALAIFDGGRRKAVVRQARDQYDEAAGSIDPPCWRPSSRSRTTSPSATSWPTRRANSPRRSSRRGAPRRCR